jgi:uncharacterized protein YeaO (DUF488 family)
MNKSTVLCLLVISGISYFITESIFKKKRYEEISDADGETINMRKLWEEGMEKTDDMLKIWEERSKRVNAFLDSETKEERNKRIKEGKYTYNEFIEKSESEENPSDHEVSFIIPIYVDEDTFFVNSDVDLPPKGAGTVQVWTKKKEDDDMSYLELKKKYNIN